MSDFKNFERRNANITLLIGFLGLVMVFLPNIFSIDMMDGGAPMMFLGVFIFISSIFVFFMFNKRAKIVNALFEMDKKLAYWEIDNTLLKSFLKEEYEKRKSENKAKLFIMIFFFILFGAIFTIVAFDEVGFSMLLIFAVITVFLALAARVIPMLSYNKKIRGRGYVFISKDAILINDTLHDFTSIGSRLKKVGVYSENPRLLYFTYSYIMSYGKFDYTVYVPVPIDKYEESNRILQYFDKSKQGGK